MHVNLKVSCKDFFVDAIFSLGSFLSDDVGELASGLGGFMGIFLGW